MSGVIQSVVCYFTGHDPVNIGTWDRPLVKCNRCGRWLKW